MKRLSHKVCVFVFTAITLTLLFLTVLMHLKYHISRSELVNSRHTIFLSDMKWSIERGMSLGVDLIELKNIQKIIEDGGSNERAIESVSVFSIAKNKPTVINSTKPIQKEDLVFGKKLMESLYSTKKDYWSFDHNGKTFVGMSFKDALGLSIGGIFIQYSADLIKKESKYEIDALYLRLSACLIVILIMSVVIGIKTIRSIDISIKGINDSLDKQIKNKQYDVVLDNELIPDRELKRIFLSAIKSYRETTKKLTHLHYLLDESKKEDKRDV